MRRNKENPSVRVGAKGAAVCRTTTIHQPQQRPLLVILGTHTEVVFVW